MIDIFNVEVGRGALARSAGSTLSAAYRGQPAGLRPMSRRTDALASGVASDV